MAAKKTAKKKVVSIEKTAKKKDEPKAAEPVTEATPEAPKGPIYSAWQIAQAKRRR